MKNIGVDIESVGRFRKLPFQRNRSFYGRIFTAKEIAYCLSKKDPYPHFAARFAAKEAIAKALNASVYQAGNFEISNRKDGRPVARIRNIRRAPRVLVSLSHTHDYAVAIAVTQ